MTTKSSVLALVLKFRNAIKEKDNDRIYNIFEEVLALLPESKKLSSDLNIQENVICARDIFVSEFHSSLSEFILDSFTSDWLESDSQGRRLHTLVSEYLKNSPPEEMLIILVRAIVKTEVSFKLHHLISFLESLLRSNCVAQSMFMYCQQLTENSELSDKFSKTISNKKDRALLEQMQEFVKAVSSLPDVITPKLHKLSSNTDFFYPQKFVAFISREIISVLKFVYDRMKEGKNSTVAVVSALVGKLALTGHGQLLWKYLLDEIEIVCIRDFLWQRIVQQLISNLEDRSIELAVTPLIIQATSYESVEAFLGSLPISKSKLTHVLTYKLVFVRHFSNSRVLQNIFGYLVSRTELRAIFLKTFKMTLNVWSDGSSLRHRSFEQSLYLSQAVMVCIAFIGNDSNIIADVKETATKALLDGLPNYLGSTIVETRQMGMVVAQNLSLIIHPNGNKLEFEIEKNEMTNSLIELLIVPEKKSSQYDSEQPEEPIMQPDHQIQTQTEKSNNVPVKQQASEPLDSDDDDEDELKPYPQNATPTVNKKKPMYLAQCMEGLLKHDDPELVEECLKNSEMLIREHPETSEMFVEMCKILLHLEDRFSLSGFMLLRHRAMVSLLVGNPKAVSKYLTKEFYEGNYNIRQRMDILEVLSAASRELSSPIDRSTKNISLDEVSVKHDDFQAEWKKIVEDRIEQKTRRFGKGKTKPTPVPTANRFSNVAGWFFYPLLQYYDKKENCLDLLGDDHVLLQRLLCTLGIIMHSAMHIPSVCQMARSLFQFTWCFRIHPQAGVRHAVLYAVCMAVVAVGSSLLVSNMEEDISDLKDWLQLVFSQDTDTECKKLAAQALLLINSCIKEELTNMSS